VAWPGLAWPPFLADMSRHALGGSRRCERVRPVAREIFAPASYLRTRVTHGPDGPHDSLRGASNVPDGDLVGAQPRHLAQIGAIFEKSGKNFCAA
jgi:hypothetical protein